MGIRSAPILVVLSIMFVGLILGQDVANAQAPEVTNAQLPEVTIEELKQRPEAYLEKPIKLRAKLTAVREKPWQFPREFVLEDEKGNQFPVAVWAPLEAILPPDAETKQWTKEQWDQWRRYQMGYYLDK